MLTIFDNGLTYMCQMRSINKYPTGCDAQLTARDL